MEHETESAETESAEAGPAEPGLADAVPGPAGGEPRAVRFPVTGEPRVDAALQLLDRLPELPVAEHPELFEQVHAQLTDVLGELDSGTAGAAGPQAS